MRADAVARRYARALFKLAEEKSQLDEIGAAVGAIARLIAEPAVERVIGGPVNRERKRTLTLGIADECGAPPILRDFLSLLVEHDRLDHLSAISTVYGELVDRRNGITRATIRSAAPLASDLLKEIVEVFSKSTGKRVIATVETAPELLAGAVVHIEGRTYDGSVRSQLDRLHRRMATAG